MRNVTKIRVNDVDFWFSYSTIVAVRDERGNLHVSENRWSNTTGKHLNYLDGGNKKERLSKEAFNNILDKVCDANGIKDLPTLGFFNK